jgi:hypothetical protein
MIKKEIGDYYYHIATYDEKKKHKYMKLASKYGSAAIYFYNLLRNSNPKKSIYYLKRAIGPYQNKDHLTNLFNYYEKKYDKEEFIKIKIKYLSKSRLFDDLFELSKIHLKRKDFEDFLRVLKVAINHIIYLEDKDLVEKFIKKKKKKFEDEKLMKFLELEDYYLEYIDNFGHIFFNKLNFKF